MQTPSFTNPKDADRTYLNFIHGLPEDVLIGGEPCSLDDVPFFGKRTVLFSCERFQFLPNEEEVVTDLLQAYYAPDQSAVFEYCAEYGIDYFVVDQRHFTQESLRSGNYFFAPYNDGIAAQIARQNRFALSSLSEFEVVFDDSERAIIACKES